MCSVHDSILCMAMRLFKFHMFTLHKPRKKAAELLTNPFKTTHRHKFMDFYRNRNQNRNESHISHFRIFFATTFVIKREFNAKNLMRPNSFSWQNSQKIDEHFNPFQSISIHSEMKSSCGLPENIALKEKKISTLFHSFINQLNRTVQSDSRIFILKMTCWKVQT